MPPDDVIEDISLYKKVTESSVSKDALFQYKHYAEQKPLTLDQNELSQLADVITGKIHALSEELEAVGKIFIKICMDQYCAGDPVGIAQLLAIFLEMIESAKPSIITNSFNLLLNLGLHVHLLEPYEDGRDNNIEKEPRLMTAIVIDDLFEKLQEMCIYLILSDVTASESWNAALTCFLLFSVSGGTIDKRRANCDSRIFYGLHQYCSDISSKTESILVACLVYSMYSKSANGLDYTQLNRIGGINAILKLYHSVLSEEALDSLFLVIYDFVLNRLSNREGFEVSDTQRVQILEFMKSIDVPQYLCKIFVCIPESFVENFIRYAYIEESKRDAEWARQFSQLDKTVLVAVLYDIEQLASFFTCVCQILNAFFD